MRVKKIIFIASFCTFICVVVCTPLCKAYIPHLSFLLKRVAKLHGRGMYKIEQELLFKHGITDLTLKETWWVNNHNMRLDVTLKNPSSTLKNTSKNTGKTTNKTTGKTTDKKLYLRFIYNTRYKTFKNTKNRLVKKPISLYHIERPFHIRNPESLKKLFYLWHTIPLNPTTTTTPPTPPASVLTESIKGVEPVILPPVPPDFITLSKKQGVVMYRIVSTATKKPSMATPTLWIEQDEFVLRAWEWKTPQNKITAHMKTSGYKAYPGLFFPTRRQFTWFTNNTRKEVIITVTNVQKIKPHKKWFKKTKLHRANTIPSNLNKAHQDIIYEFYKQFR